MAVVKTLFLIRHAHREIGDRSLDNGLSEKGHTQVQRLVKYFRKRFKDEEWEPGDLSFQSSAKIRCVQTLKPLADLAGQPVEVHPGLIEQPSAESFSHFQDRIQSFIKDWLASPVSVQMVASHGDVLPIIAYHLVGAAVDFKKAGFLELEWDAGQVYLKQLIPSLKPFYEEA